MASSREYLDYILDRLAGLPGISFRAMMGEFIQNKKARSILAGIAKWSSAMRP